jgi:hypothetical protein
MQYLRALPDIPPAAEGQPERAWELPQPPLALAYLRQQPDHQRGHPSSDFEWERDYYLRPPPEGYQRDRVVLPDAMQWELVTIGASRATRTMSTELRKLDPYALTFPAPFGDLGLIPRIGDWLSPTQLRSMNEKRLRVIAEWQREVRHRCPPLAQREPVARG